MKPLRIMFAISMLALAGCVLTPAPDVPPAPDLEDRALVSEGRTVAVLRCSRCHALDGFSHSPNPKAAPMAQLLARYDDGMLARGSVDGIRIGHDPMPEFSMPSADAEALVAYLRSTD